MRLIHVGLPLSLLLLLPDVGVAQEGSEGLKGLRIVVPEARGRKSWGRARLSKTLRRTLTDAVGPLVSSRDFSKAQGKLKLKRAARYEPANLAKAAKAVKAQYVLDVSISKKGWLFTARALLINAETGEVQMDFRSQYYKPRADAADRGKRVGKRTIQKLQELKEGGGFPAIAQNDPPPPPPDKVDDPPPPPPDKVDDPPPPAVTQNDPPPDKVDDPPPPDKVDDPPPPPVVAQNDPPPPTTVTPAPPPPVVQRGPPSAEVEVTRVTESDAEFFRAAVGGGSGLLRTYTVASDAVAPSALSYQLLPLSLVTAELEGSIPGVGVAFTVGGAFRPVRYRLAIGADETTPRGAMIDAYGHISYQIPLAGTGKQTFKLSPRVGARLGYYSVEDHPGNVVLGATAITLAGGLGARLPINEVLEINAAVEGGYVLSYSERPATTGESASGFLIGGDVGARIWLTSMVGIAFDNRFTFESIGFSGAPTRQPPSGEGGRLQNATITTKDLKTSIGIAFRL